MNVWNKMGVTQKIMSDLSGVTAPTINKIVTAGGYVPVDTSATRNIRFGVSTTRDILKKAMHFVPNEEAKILAFYNFKGGVGKTTLCYQISSHLALMGYNVLVVDADPQGHLSTSLGYDTESNFLTLYDSIIGNVPIEETIQCVYEGLDCIPSNIGLSRLEPALVSKSNNLDLFKDSFFGLKNKYDFIIFDTNPTISHLNRNIIMASHLLSVVVETQAYALNGLKILMSDLKKFCAESNMNMPNIMIIPNKYEERSASSGEAMAVLRDSYGEYVIPDFAVRKSEEIHTSCKNSTPLAFFCRSNSIALEDVKDVLHYMLKNKIS